MKRAISIPENKVQVRPKAGVNFRIPSPEVAIWKAVIMQAVLDIVNTSKRTEHKVAKENAINWFDVRNINFVTVCHYARLEPEWVVKKIAFAIKNQRTWRRDCDIRKATNDL
jgi:hypothetical protein